MVKVKFKVNVQVKVKVKSIGLWHVLCQRVLTKIEIHQNKSIMEYLLALQFEMNL